MSRSSRRLALVLSLLCLLMWAVGGLVGCSWPGIQHPASSIQHREASAEGTQRITVTITEIKPNEKAVAAAGGEVRKGAESVAPALLDVADLLPITLVMKAAHVMEAFFERVSRAQVTTVKVEIEGVCPTKLDARPSGVTAEWPEGGTSEVGAADIETALGVAPTVLPGGPE